VAKSKEIAKIAIVKPLRLPFRPIGSVDFEVYARRGGDKIFSRQLSYIRDDQMLRNLYIE
jgi:hypothetical protein